MKKIKYMLYTCLVSIFLAGIPVCLLAQGANNNWHFGNFNQISFNTGLPVFSTNSSINTFESSAAVSDESGNLLFYTMGARIWDRYGTEMPNANGLLGNGPFSGSHPAGSGRNNVHIVPHPGNRDQYFVFSAEPIETPGGKVYYHLVDMSLNGGLGDVVPGMKNIEIVEAYGREAYTVARGSCGTYWFIGAMSTEPASYYAFKIDANGVDHNPVVTFVPLPEIETIGQTEISRNGIAISAGSNYIMMADFNKQSGTFSHFQLFPNGHSGQYLELSPNHEHVYIIDYNKIRQYDLEAYPDIPAIAATGFNLSPWPSPLAVNYEDLRQGPDGNLYAVRLNFANQFLESYAIDRISNPNGGNIAWLSQNSVAIPQNARFITFGSGVLPRQVIDTVIHAGFRTDTTLCHEAASVTLYSPNQNNYNYYWNNGSQAGQLEAMQAGLYWVISKSNTDCIWHIDSFKVKKQEAPHLNIGNDTTICKGGSITVDLNQPGIEQYLWNDGYTGAERTITEDGVYLVTLRAGACSYADTLSVEIIDPYFRIVPDDTVLCKGDLLVLRTESNMDNQVQWNNGLSGPALEISVPGTYTATAENKCGQFLDAVKISPVNCHCKPEIPTAFTPNGDGKNDLFQPLLRPDCALNTFEFTVYNRYGNIIFFSGTPGKGWNGTYPNQALAENGVYTYMLKLSNSFGNNPAEIYKGRITLIR